MVTVSNAAKRLNKIQTQNFPLYLARRMWPVTLAKTFSAKWLGLDPNAAIKEYHCLNH